MELMIFLLVTALLLTEGFFWSRTVLGKKSFALSLSLALPLAALSNVLLTFVFTVTSIPLSVFPLLGGHAVLTIIAFVLSHRAKKHDDEAIPHRHMSHRKSITERTVIGTCVALLATSMIYTFAHAVLLPSFHYDTTTNWTMRSQISFYDQKIAFDPNEDRGMAKPQYPFLFHALQITANQGQERWNDRAANTILLLLAWSALAATGLMLSRIKGVTMALLAVTLIAGVPLTGIHLAQGYGDIVLLELMVLSAAALAVALHEKNGRALLLSGLFATACVWTKSEGLFFALGPWLLLSAFLFWKEILPRREAVRAIITSIILSAPWPLFLLMTGQSFTPHHESDLSFSFHADAFRELLPALFARGSFGGIWYLIPAAFVMLFIMERQKKGTLRRLYLLIALWGAIVFAENLFIYVFTRNAEFLINGQSFYRQMLLPASLFLLSIILLYPTKDSSPH